MHPMNIVFALVMLVVLPGGGVEVRADPRPFTEISKCLDARYKDHGREPIVSWYCQELLSE